MEKRTNQRSTRTKQTSTNTTHTKARTASRTHTNAHRTRPQKGHTHTKRPVGKKAPFRQRDNRRPHTNFGKKKNDKIPVLAKDTPRVIYLGGVEEVGRNMTAIEYNDDIYVIDAGFMFEEEDKPGIDYILPNTEYLEDRKDKIRGIFITHGHLDHIGGIPYIIDRLGNPPIYTRKLTAVMIEKRQQEFPHLKNLKIHIVDEASTIKVGELPVTFFATTHTIPDSMGVMVETPYGGILSTGDIKLDHDNGEVHKHEYENFSIFKKKKALLLTMDSTNVWKPGWSIPEHVVFKTFEKIIQEANHRLIIGTFASQLERLIEIIKIAERNGKKVVVEGRSMKNNIAVAQELGLLKAKEHTLITSNEMTDYPESKILILATGAQGDEYAALMRMSNKSHRQIKLNPKDTVVLSSSVIPGNEKSVQKLKDNISRLGVHIVTIDTSDVHASGHGYQEEAKWIQKQINPKFFVPQHGHHYMLRVHADIARKALKLDDSRIKIPDNGTIIEIRDGGTKLVKLKEKAPHTTRVVEGLHVRDIQDVVINDRKALATDGMFVIVATVNMRTGKLRKSPDIISRGFVYLRESQEMLQQSRLIVKRIVEGAFSRSRTIDVDTVKADLTKELSKFLLQQSHKNPIIIPVIIGV